MKFLKFILTGVAAIALALSASAQFQGTAPSTVDLLGGTPLLITAGATSNLTVTAKIGKDGFSVMPRVIATNASTAVVAVQVAPVNKLGEVFGTLTQVGTVTLNGTTVVPGYLNTGSNYNIGALRVTLTNGHTATIIVSNVFVTVP